MERSESPDFLPVDVEEQLTHLLDRWANDNRLSAATASSIQEAVQENDDWNQRFWTRMNTVLIVATTSALYTQSEQWSMERTMQKDLAPIIFQNSFDNPDYRPYLSLST